MAKFRKMTPEEIYNYKHGIKPKKHIRILTLREIRVAKYPNTFTDSQWVYALDYFDNRCAICGCPPSKDTVLARDHWIPLSYKGEDNPGTVVANIIPMCHGVGGCNNYKSNIMPYEWLKRTLGEQTADVIMKRIQVYFDRALSRLRDTQGIS